MLLRKTSFPFFIILLMSIALGSCLKPNNQDFVEERIHIQGILIAGEEVQEIKVQEIKSEKNITDAKVKICDNQGCFDLMMTSPGIYQSESDLIIYPDSTYQLEVTWNGTICSSSTQIPSELSWVNVESTIINIDTNNTGQQALSAEWLSGTETSFVMELQNIEENPEQINYSVPTFSFENTYYLPINNTNITLQDLFFTHYGAHRFIVYSIDQSYQDVFFYQPQIQQIQPSEGMDNIEGAFGVFVGVNKLSIDLIVN